VRHVLFGVVVPAVVMLAPILLLGHPERLAHPAPWVLLLSSTILFLLQPALPTQKDEKVEQTDRGSAVAILAGVSLAMLGTVVQFAARAELEPEPLSAWVFAGTALIVLGSGLRLWAIRTLGRFFTAQVQVKGDHQVVQDGPYRHVRHPSYTGILLGFAGNSLLFHSWVGAVLTAVLVLPIYLYRIRIEEHALGTQLGDAYRRYQATTGALVPRLF